MKLLQGLIFSVLFLLTACGFHLRGQEPLPPEFTSVFIASNAPYDNLLQIIRKRFKRLKIVVAHQPNEAAYTLRLVNENFTESAQSVSVDTQYRQYQLYYSATFQLLDKSGTVVLPDFIISSTRYYSTQTGQALGSSFEKNRLHDEMQSDVASQLLNRLRSTQTKRALAHENTSTTTR